jgi:hypothetical protein
LFSTIFNRYNVKLSGFALRHICEILELGIGVTNQKKKKQSMRAKPNKGTKTSEVRKDMCGISNSWTPKINVIIGRNELPVCSLGEVPVLLPSCIC